ncbi:RIC1-domain-containing protein [Phlebopus sp. FC_14]|nr:RIC1-domain-containing protein [Phlebopus sp. FC_14]
MYFPTSAARQLSSVPALPDVPPESVLCLQPSPRRSLFCALTKHALTIWRVRPPAPLAYLSRSQTSLSEHGRNLAVTWSPDGSRIIIQTTSSYLILVTIDFTPHAASYQPPEVAQGAQRNFLAGAGEGRHLQSLSLALEGVIRAEGRVLSVSPRNHHILFSTSSPPAVQRIPWPSYDDGDNVDQSAHTSLVGYDTWVLSDHEMPWLVDSDVTVSEILQSSSGVEAWITSDGRVYFVRLQEDTYMGADSDNEEARDGDSTSSGNQTRKQERLSIASSSVDHRFHWQGTCIHDFEVPRWVQKSRHVESDDPSKGAATYVEPRRALKVAINAKFSLVAVGTYSASILFTSFPAWDGRAPTPQTVEIPNPYNRQQGKITAMEWSSDGYVLAVGWEHGWAIFSVGGRCIASGFGTDEAIDNARFQDAFMYGLEDLFWSPGNFELVVLAKACAKRSDGQIYVLPFAKSATTCQHSPDNTRYAFLQMDDRALIYRGADQPDMSVINPESDVWQHIKARLMHPRIPQSYLASNWPIRYSTISNDGRLIAIAGRRGVIHYSAASGRWKLFSSVAQEQAFAVRGGLLWFHHVLIAAVEVSRSYQIRLYSRDLELSNQNVLHREVVTSPVIVLSLVDNSLLVYTADNMLSHYLIIPTTDSIKLHLCGSISFDGIIAVPSAVRVLSWMIPTAQKQLGDPVDDLAVATVLMMVGGQLVLLRPRKASSGSQEVKYDMQIFADRMEFCWIHLRGIGALENSLWGYDGQGMRVWLNALTIESSSPSDQAPQSVKESVNIPLDFYPLSVLMDKGIIIGAEHESITRINLSFVMFRHATSSHLFLHHVLRYHLENGQVHEAVQLATHYQHLVFFAHALEILLHTVVESEASTDTDSGSVDNALSITGALSAVVEFLDHFDVALDVVVGCARKTEVTRWRRLFSTVGNPQSLFEICLASNRLKTAGSYLLVLHNLEQLNEDNDDAIRLLRSAIDAQDWQLCRELLRFLHSVDDSGMALRRALADSKLSEDINEL